MIAREGERAATSSPSDRRSRQGSDHCSQRSYTCPECWRDGRERLDRYAILLAVGVIPIVACSDCAARRRRAGEVLDWVGPVTA